MKSMAVEFNWRRYGDVVPNAKQDVVVIRSVKPDRVLSGSYYNYRPEEDRSPEWFLEEDFRKAHPDDLWVYQCELLPNG